MENTDLFLASSEGYGLDEPRQCMRVQRMHSDTRDDLLLVRLSPPIIGQPYGLGDRDIDMVLVASRHKDCSLFPIVDWPAYVHVARPLIENPDSKKYIRDNEFEVIAWAELYPTEAAAKEKKI